MIRSEGVALILGIDRFLSEARALTNLIGNGVAAIVVGHWTKSLDEVKLRHVLSGGEAAQMADEPETLVV